MHEDLPALFPRLVDPVANWCQLRLERVDAIVAHALDVKDLDAAFALLYPERARLRGCEARMEGALAVFRWDKCALANRDDMRDTECVEHVCVRGVVPTQQN